MLRIVADTNIYISALNFGGPPDQVLALARRGRVELFISKPILDEIEGVLTKKFHWPVARVREALGVIREFARIVEPSERIAVIKKDEPDNRVLECALAAKATIVVRIRVSRKEPKSRRCESPLSARAFLEAVEG